MTDRELLELAAKAVGIEIRVFNNNFIIVANGLGEKYWNPLTDDGDALRLAVKLEMALDLFKEGISVCCLSPNDTVCDQVEERIGDDKYAATRRAIVRAVAEIGRTV